MTLLLVPVIYSIFVLDLKLIKWESPAAAEPPAVEPTEPAFHYADQQPALVVDTHNTTRGIRATTLCAVKEVASEKNQAPPNTTVEEKCETFNEEERFRT